MSGFTHLHVHTEYSLLEGAVTVKKLPGLCADAGMPAVAVTDTNNNFCALEFSEYAKGAGIQPIFGCQVSVRYVAPAVGERPRMPAPVVRVRFKFIAKKLYFCHGVAAPCCTLCTICGLLPCGKNNFFRYIPCVFSQGTLLSVPA